jgi:diacylglycerol kinase (ATP)
MAKKFSLSSRVESFKHAIRGIGLMLRSQQNAWIHAMATISVVVFGLLFGVTRSQWCWLVLAIVAVWSAEALNTALEFLADFASPEFHPLVKKAKDVAAGAVLISAMGSVIIGLFVLGPYLLRFLYSLRSK